MPVQPMKTISAVAITENLSPEEVIGAGVGVGIVVTLLGMTNAIELVNWLIPLEVVRGLQLGLGLSLLMRGLMLQQSLPLASAVDCILLGCAGFILSLFALRFRQGRVIPAALVITVVGLSIALAQCLTDDSVSFELAPTIPVFWAAGDITFDAALSGFLKAGLAQIPLTTLNSVVSVCELNTNLFPNNKISRRSVATSVGLMNLSGIWLGAMPMCHGAGGLAAQYKFGARSGSSVVVLGCFKMLLACVLGFGAEALLTQFPQSLLGVLLAFAGIGLAVAGSKPRAEDSEAIYTTIVATAAATLVLKTGWGCAVGVLVAAFNGGFQHVVDFVKRKLAKKMSEGKTDDCSVEDSQEVLDSTHEKSESVSGKANNIEGQRTQTLAQA